MDQTKATSFNWLNLSFLVFILLMALLWWRIFDPFTDRDAFWQGELARFTQECASQPLVANYLASHEGATMHLDFRNRIKAFGPQYCVVTPANGPQVLFPHLK